MNRIDFGDCRETMRRWAADGVKVQTCVTSPPYFGLRDYGHEGQIGLEPTPEAYIAAMVEVFRCVRDVLADDGTLWLNIGDSYARSAGPEESKLATTHTIGVGYKRVAENGGAPQKENRPPPGLKPKDLIGIPWMLAFALRADGWYLRQDIIWHKPNPMPESVRDRCTKAHEYIFLLSKSERYYFDSEAIKGPAKTSSEGKRFGGSKYGDSDDPKHATKSGNVSKEYDKTNKRSVWTVTTKPYKGAHFATFPPDLIEPCILAGSRQGDVVLDPFMGSGTTAQVAVQHGRQYLGCELNPAYEAMQQERLTGAQVNLL
jgi:DNA modification methylase